MLHITNTDMIALAGDYFRISCIYTFPAVAPDSMLPTKILTTYSRILKVKLSWTWKSRTWVMMMIPILIRFCSRQRRWPDVSHSYRMDTFFPDVVKFSSVFLSLLH